MMYSSLDTVSHLPWSTNTNIVAADMILGDPRANCNGVGICKISIAFSVPPVSDCECKRVRIELIKKDECSVFLKIERCAISAKMLHKHFTNNGLRLYTQIALPQTLMAALELPLHLTIIPQYSTLFETHDFVFVVLICG